MKITRSLLRLIIINIFLSQFLSCGTVTLNPGEPPPPELGYPQIVDNLENESKNEALSELGKGEDCDTYANCSVGSFNLHRNAVDQFVEKTEKEMGVSQYGFHNNKGEEGNIDIVIEKIKGDEETLHVASYCKDQEIFLYMQWNNQNGVSIYSDTSHAPIDFLSFFGEEKPKEIESWEIDKEADTIQYSAIGKPNYRTKFMETEGSLQENLIIKFDEENNIFFNGVYQSIENSEESSPEKQEEMIGVFHKDGYGVSFATSFAQIDKPTDVNSEQQCNNIEYQEFIDILPKPNLIDQLKLCNADSENEQQEKESNTCELKSKFLLTNELQSWCRVNFYAERTDKKDNDLKEILSQRKNLEETTQFEIKKIEVPPHAKCEF
ncbi:MAG: hypothetical protein AB8G05_19445 [Oligoflexales bacterium]